MHKRFMIWSVLCLACATADEEPTNYTMGNGTANGGGAPVAGGQPVYPNCTGDVYCYQNERCDLNQGLCVPAQNSTATEPNGSTPNNGETPPLDQGVSMLVDAGGHAGQTGACRTPSDIAFFQSELLCTEACEDAYELAESRCQMTPSRIADCLATASQEQNECQGLCTPISGSVAICLTRCNDLSNISSCGLECLRSTFSFTGDCEACFGSLFECGGTFCQSLCLSGDTDECSACLSNSCGRDFVGCAGMMLPQ